MERKNIYVILGMARSGTSVIARSLQTLGVDLGGNLVPAKETWNAKGFWEDKDIVYKINRGIVHTLHFTEIQYMKNISEVNNAEIAHLKQFAISILSERMKNKQNWGFKDPRTAKFLPFWQDVFSKLQLNEYYIIALRNPLASAYSYQRVKGVDIEMGLLLWLIHLISAIDGTLHKNCIIVDYDSLLKNPLTELNRMKNFLPFFLDTQKEEDFFIDKFIDTKLQHYDYTESDLLNHSAARVVPLCIKVYALLKQAAKDNIDLNNNNFLYKWEEIKKEFDYFHSIYNYVELLFSKNRENEKNIRRMKKSIPWKLIFPLRVIDNFIKNQLMRLKEKKRLARFYAD